MINDLMLLGCTFCNATEKWNVHHSYHWRWRKTIAKVNELAANQTVVPFKIHGESCEIHPWCPSGLTPIEGDLKQLIFELREQGYQVNSHTLKKEAVRLSDIFKAKGTKAKVSSMRCFVKRVGLSHWVSTHVAKKDHKASEEESSHFLAWNESWWYHQYG